MNTNALCFQLHKLFKSQLRRLFNHPLFCMSTSSFVSYLYSVLGVKRDRDHSAQSARAYKRFLWKKTAQYSLLSELMLRTLYVSFLAICGDHDAVKGNLPYNPILVLLLYRYHFFAHGTMLLTAALLPLFAVVLDYAFYFKLVNGNCGQLCESANEIVVKNGHRFVELNGRQFRATEKQEKLLGVWQKKVVKVGSFLVGSSKANQAVHWVLLPKLVKNSTRIKFHNNILELFPYLSKHLRVQMIFYSAVFEMIVTVLNSAFCKYFFSYLFALFN